MAAEDDPDAWVSLDASFHSAVARASGNRVFENVVTDIRESLSHQSQTLNLVADRKRGSDAEHRAILKAIENGSAEEASAAMAAHPKAVRSALATILGAD